MTAIPKKGEIWTQTGTQGQCHVEIGILLPQANKVPEVKREKDVKQILPKNLQREYGPADTLILDF